MADSRRQFAAANLERLAQVSGPPAGLPEGDSALQSLGSLCELSVKIVKKWSIEVQDSIKIAIDKQVFGQKEEIDWHTALLPFLESMAMYLRDWGPHYQARQKYHQYKNGDTQEAEMTRDEAIDHYLQADYGIREVAQVWGLDYLTLCDLVEKTPDGHQDWDGPFCGAFFSTDAQKAKPFIGIGFKGTNPLNQAEAMVDYDYQLVKGGQYLGDDEISSGIYTGLFGKFVSEEINPAYETISQHLEQLAKSLSQSAVRTHVTGHSLGGSYSSLCYAQLLIQYAPDSSVIAMGDEYTFGAPRVGSAGWADAHAKLVEVHAGQAWRIVNDDDVVSQVPATTLQPDQLDFIHIDSGRRIFKDKAAEEIGTERGFPPPPPYSLKKIQDLFKTVLKTRYHLPHSYFKALEEAAKS